MPEQFTLACVPCGNLSLTLLIRMCIRPTSCLRVLPCALRVCFSAAAPPPLLLPLLPSPTFTSVPLGRCSKQTTATNGHAGGPRQRTPSSLAHPTGGPRHTQHTGRLKGRQKNEKCTTSAQPHTYSSQPASQPANQIVCMCPTRLVSCAVLPWQSNTELTASCIQPHGHLYPKL